jgi:transposase
MRRRKANVELFEEMRREYEFGIGTIQGVARKFGVHRRLVREALKQAIPVEKPSPTRTRPRLGPVVEFIDEILQADRHAPRKQRHTAHRIFTRLQVEKPGDPVAESTVREYVHERRRALGLLSQDLFVPQSYAWGVEGQADWYEAVAELGGEEIVLQVFTLRSMASGAAFHRAYRRATQQAFLEAQELAFAYFGGVFHRVRYDNLKAAVQRIVRGFRREETARFHAFRSHWRFQSEFCTPGEGHEKGGVENEVGTFRRNHWVPLPQAADLDELNAHLLIDCRQDEARTIAGRTHSVGAALLIERAQLLPLATEGFDLAETSFPLVNASGCVKVGTNAYSVPAAAGTRVEVKLRAAMVEIWHEKRRLAVHERCYERNQELFNLEHYLDVLEHKPGALAGSKPLDQWRKAGRWPASFDRLWEGLIERHGQHKGTKEMVELLQLGRKHGQERFRTAVEAALAAGCQDPAAIQHLLEAPTLARAVPAALEIDALLPFERPMPSVMAYDQLLVGAGIR